MHTYDNVTIELAGRNLIEASAGTGKTFAIACLYLRLVVEKGLLPENILVVTFTDAATRELRSRIRGRLRGAREWFAGEAGQKDDFLAGVLGGGAWPGTEEALRRLDAALQTFDCAAISTIHGFCSRALQENAFESGSLYDTELVKEQSPILQEIVDDFWRRTFFSGDAPLLASALRQGWSPEQLAGFLRGKLGNPELRLVPLHDDEAVERLARECDETGAALVRLWDEEGEAVAALLREHPGLSRSQKNYHPELVPGLLEGMAAHVAGGNPCDLFAGFEKFTTRFIRKQALKKSPPPEHAFFDLCARLEELVTERFIALKGSLFRFAGEQLAELKGRRNIRFYDDLLVDLYRALEGESGGALAGALRSRYRAALIDEFQDTDPVQYRIFRRIYHDDTAPLFLIGDPKQAIYSFRGADIFAYLEAREDVPADRRFTMEQNWRSTPEMVAGVNLLFRQQEERPFIFANIGCPEVTAAAEGRPLALEGRDPAPLQLWFMGRGEEDGKQIPIARGNRRIVAAVAAEIAGLLADGRAGRATVAERPVLPEDIAVIVRSHAQAAMVQEALRSYRIPAVVQSSDSLFTTAEAREICRILEGVAEPANGAKVRAALATGLFGASGNDIARYMEDEEAWELRQAAFREYHDLWHARGFMTMFRALLAREKGRERLLALDDGERRLTNYLHCSEVIHQAASEGKLGMDALGAWFGERVNLPPEGEEFQIRLESDEKAVRIVTVHVSKGLEYPIVFCPFSWGGVRDEEETVVCHEGYEMVMDFGSAEFDRHLQAARKESLAENVRLLYVALTRAKYRCYLVWGKFRHAESSAPAYLLHAPGGAEGEDLVAALEGVVKDISDAALLARLGKLQAESKGCLSVVENPEPEGWVYQRGPGAGEAIACLPFTAEIESDWRVASFTSFAASHHREAELPDRDQGGGDDPLAAAPGPAPEGSIFAFPRGPQAGIFLHALFEELHFTGADAGVIRPLAARELERHSYPATWLGAVSTMVENVVKVPLAEGGGAFCLADLAAGSWQAELEFFFPLQAVEGSALAAVLRRWGVVGEGVDLTEIARRLDFTRVRGMVRGFIDMVFHHGGRFYLVDWKSNHLGNCPEDYHQARLAREMERHLYHLQYLLYTVALDRYLSLRVPGYGFESHFGGALYIFLRGVDPARPELGVFRHLPPAGLIRDLAACLIEPKEQHHAA